MVVADGDGAFLRTMHKKEFHDSDVIGVSDRTVDRERLELLGQQSRSSVMYAPMALQDSGPAWPRDCVFGLGNGGNGVPPNCKRVDFRFSS